ncbi:GTP cyclohydrolase II [Candidatus Woesearchaeota archaeon]|nr:GTP cyclohydrolase II [Candidatus Woesearchaeota archaeon]
MRSYKKATATLPTKFGVFSIIVYQMPDGKEHLALLKKTHQKHLLRIHSECMTGDVFHSLKCDCQAQLTDALQRVGKEGGVILYLRQEGRGIGLFNKIKAYALQEKGMDTVEANLKLGFKDDERDFQIAAEILRDLNIKEVKLLTNNIQKQKALEGFGIKVERVPQITPPSKHNYQYLKTKKEKMGHLIPQKIIKKVRGGS